MYIKTIEGWTGKAKCLMLLYLECLNAVLSDFRTVIQFLNYARKQEYQGTQPEIILMEKSSSCDVNTAA